MERSNYGEGEKNRGRRSGSGGSCLERRKKCRKENKEVPRVYLASFVGSRCFCETGILTCMSVHENRPFSKRREASINQIFTWALSF